MANISVILIVSIVCVFAVQAQSYGSNPQYYPQCQFSSSCTEITFCGNTMYSNCRTGAGSVVNSSINVNLCVGVDYYGKLDCSSNFIHKCSDVEFNGITVAARCERSDGTKVFSNRALDDCIGNVGGKLTCC